MDSESIENSFFLTVKIKLHYFVFLLYKCSGINYLKYILYKKTIFFFVNSKM